MSELVFDAVYIVSEIVFNVVDAAVSGSVFDAVYMLCLVRYLQSLCAFQVGVVCVVFDVALLCFVVAYRNRKRRVSSETGR